MGIYDRDYVRNRPTTPQGPFRGSGGGLPHPRLWSANTWLIVINIAVFVLGAMFLAQPVKMEAGIERIADAEFNPEHTQEVEQEVRSPSGMLAHPIIDTRSGEIVAWQRFQVRPLLHAWGSFSTGKGLLELQVWRLITFQFLHFNFDHLLLNMIGLFFFGPLVERGLGSRRRYLAFYLTCGIFGALMYLVLNLLGYLFPGANIPGLLISDVYTPLIGASAGVFGVLMAAAYFAGDLTMYVFLILPMKIRTGAYLLAAIEAGRLVLNLDNAGGSAAHLGGAIAGFYFIRNMHLLEGFFDIFGPSPPKPGRPAPARRKPKARGHAANRGDREIDVLLDKVKEKGLHSLTDKEREILNRATRDRRGE